MRRLALHVAARTSRVVSSSFSPVATGADATPAGAVMLNALGAPPGPGPMLALTADPAAIVEYLDAVLDYLATALTPREGEREVASHTDPTQWPSHPSAASLVAANPHMYKVLCDSVTLLD